METARFLRTAYNCSVLTLILLLQNSIATTSPPNMLETVLGRNHYFLYKDIKVSWLQAFVRCQADGAHLLYIDTKQELQFLINFLNNSGLPNIEKEIFWTSGSDAYSENNFVWMSTGKSVGNGMWASGQPDNYARQEHCVNMYGEYGFLLNDDTCSGQKFYICKNLINNNQLTFPHNDVGINSENIENHNADEMRNAEPQSLKLDVHVAKLEGGGLLTVLAFMAISLTVIAAISLKQEVNKIMQARDKKITRKYDGRHQNIEQEMVYDPNL